MRQCRSTSRMSHHKDRLFDVDLPKVGVEDPVQKEADRVKRRGDRHSDQQYREIAIPSLRNFFVPGETEHLEVVGEIEKEEH